MIVKTIFLLLILSLEATIGVPFFFLYLGWLWFDQWSLTRGIVAQFISSLLLALFYDMSWPLLATMLLGVFLIRKQTSQSDQRLLFWSLYVVVVSLFTYLAQVNWQLISALHGLVFIVCVWLMGRFQHSTSLIGKGLLQ